MKCWLWKTSILLGCTILMMTMSCNRETPKDRFHKELNAKIDVLIKSLKDFGPGTVSGKAVVRTGEKEATGDSQIPHSLVVANAAEDVFKHMSMMNMETLEDIKKGINNTEWTGRINSDFSTRASTIKTELETIKSKVKASPDAFKASYNINGMSLGDYYSYKTVRLDGNDVVFMTSETTGIKLNDLINMKLTDYLKGLSIK